jgi:hypothetical protein
MPCDDHADRQDHSKRVEPDEGGDHDMYDQVMWPELWEAQSRQ